MNALPDPSDRRVWNIAAKIYQRRELMYKMKLSLKYLPSSFEKRHLVTRPCWTTYKNPPLSHSPCCFFSLARRSCLPIYLSAGYATSNTSILMAAGNVNIGIGCFSPVPVTVTSDGLFRQGRVMKSSPLTKKENENAKPLWIGRRSREPHDGWFNKTRVPVYGSTNSVAGKLSTESRETCPTRQSIVSSIISLPALTLARSRFALGRQEINLI